jgi:hypothetical protein
MALESHSVRLQVSPVLIHFFHESAELFREHLVLLAPDPQVALPPFQFLEPVLVIVLQFGQFGLGHFSLLSAEKWLVDH